MAKVLVGEVTFHMLPMQSMPGWVGRYLCGTSALLAGLSPSASCTIEPSLPSCITHVGLYTRLCLLPHTATVKAGRGLGTRLHALNTYKSFRPNNYIQALLLPCCFLLTTWLVHTSEQVFQQRGQVRWHFKHTRWYDSKQFIHIFPFKRKPPRGEVKPVVWFHKYMAWNNWLAPPWWLVSYVTETIAALWAIHSWGKIKQDSIKLVWAKNLLSLVPRPDIWKWQ